MKRLIGLLLILTAFGCQQPSVKPDRHEAAAATFYEREFLWGDTGGGHCQGGTIGWNGIPSEEWKYTPGMASPIWSKTYTEDSLCHRPVFTSINP